MLAYNTLFMMPNSAWVSFILFMTAVYVIALLEITGEANCLVSIPSYISVVPSPSGEIPWASFGQSHELVRCISWMAGRPSCGYAELP